MDLKFLVLTYLKRLWIVVLITLLCSGITAYVSMNYITPIYEAKTSMYVMKKNFNADDRPLSTESIMVNRLLMKDYRELIKSNMVTSSVIEGLKLTDTTSESLGTVLGINSRNDSNILEISALDKNPVKARDIANTVSNVFITKVRVLTNEDNINILDLAQIPVRPVKPSHVKNIALSFAVSFIGASVFVLVEPLLWRRIGTVEDVEKLLDFNVLGVIPKLNIK